MVIFPLKFTEETIIPEIIRHFLFSKRACPNRGSDGARKNLAMFMNFFLSQLGWKNGGIRFALSQLIEFMNKNQNERLKRGDQNNIDFGTLKVLKFDIS